MFTNTTNIPYLFSSLYINFSIVPLLNNNVIYLYIHALMNQWHIDHVLYRSLSNQVILILHSTFLDYNQECQTFLTNFCQ